MIESGDCAFSPCRTWRYTLWRRWGGLFAKGSYAMFIGMNPSTADESKNDPTIRRCIRFAESWGYAGLCMTNIFAFRATDPADMKVANDPVGPENDTALIECARNVGIVVAAWGVHGVHQGRDAAIAALGLDLHVLRLTKHGYPAHPLYLPKDISPKIWVDSCGKLIAKA